MRPYGEAVVDPSNPRAQAICDRCGRRTNHYRLRWQYDWRGTKLQNLRFLVCETCSDTYQQNGQRTIILPADPVPIMNARPEAYVPADNPLSALGANPSPALDFYSAHIGNMTAAGGRPAAFDGNSNKPSFMGAMIVNATFDFENYIGINWAGYPSGTYPAALDTPVITHTLSSYTIRGPNNATTGTSAFLVQGSNTAAPGSWATLASGTFIGFIGETVSGGVTAGGRYQFHRVAFWGGVHDVPLVSSDGSILVDNNGLPITAPGPGGTPIAIAQLALSVAEGSS